MNKDRITSICVTFATAFLVLLGNSCSSDSQPAHDTANPPMTIEPRVSVGKIRTGMKKGDVVAAYGEPRRRTSNALSYPTLGFAVMHDPEGNIQVVMCGDVTGLNGPLVQAFTGRTAKGIGLGSTREQVVAAYGEPSQAQTFVAGRESLGYSDLGITFSLERNKVHHMIVRLLQPSEPENSIRVTPVPQ